MLTQNSERQKRRVGNVQIANALYYEWHYRIRKAAFLSTQKRKAGFFKKLHWGRFSKALVFGARFWYPTIYSWSLKWRKNLRMRVKRALILPRTQTSLFRWKCTPSVPFPWSLAVHHQSLAFRARLCHAKNEAPEEEVTKQSPETWNVIFHSLQRMRAGYLNGV